LLSAIPDVEPVMKKHSQLLPSENQDAAESAAGCKFQKNCFLADRTCRQEALHFREVETDHFVRCCKDVSRR